MTDVPMSAKPAAASAPTLRPLTVADLVDEIFRLYRRDFRLLFAISAIVWLPASIALLVLNLSFFGGTVIEPAFDPSLLGDYATEAIVAAVVSSLALPVLFGAITAAVAARYLGRPMTIEAALRRGLACYWRVVLAYVVLIVLVIVVVMVLATLASLLLGAAVVIGGALTIAAALLGIVAAVALFVAAIWLTVTFAFIGQAIVIEDAGVLQAFGRSRTLVTRSRIRVLGINFLLGLIQAILLSVPSTFVAVIATPFPGVTSAALTQIVASLAQIAYFPVQLGALTLLYYDLRVRREGFDLTLAAEQLTRE